MRPQTGILAMFARSPIKPLQQHMESAHACATFLLPFFNSVLAEDWEKARAIYNQISSSEHDADDLKMEIRLHLPKGLFLPVPRMDILELLSKQELIANTAKDIAGIVIGRKMKIPNALADLFLKYLQRSIDASVQAQKSINELDELLESGFRGREVTFVENLIAELNKIEHDTDEIQIQVREELFAIEKTLQPIDVMFLYKIIETIGELSDCAQQVGSRLRMLTAS